MPHPYEAFSIEDVGWIVDFVSYPGIEFLYYVFGKANLFSNVYRGIAYYIFMGISVWIEGIG